MTQDHVDKQSHMWYQLFWIVPVCIVLVFLVDTFTNTFDHTLYDWDFKHYINIAENGLHDNDSLVAPFAYRYATPLLTRFLIESFNLSTFEGFRYIALTGAVLQLLMVFLLAHMFGKSWQAGTLAIFLTCASLFNVKFLLFDVFRPDHLAYPLMLIICILIFLKRPVTALILICLGLQIREFFVVPALYLMYEIFRGIPEDKQHFNRKFLVTAIIMVAAAIIVPRILIPVTQSYQYIDPIYRPKSIAKLVLTPFFIQKDINYLFCLAGHLLPVFLLSTRFRISTTWKMLVPFHPFLIIYSIIVLLMSLYGGTDYGRFMSYLFIPSIIIISSMHRTGTIKFWEVLYCISATAVFNRIFWVIPFWDFDKYIDFYAGFNNRINLMSLLRIIELAGYIIIIFFLRKWINNTATTYQNSVK